MRLTSLVRRPVLGPDGARVGRVADVVVSLEAAYPEATGLLVRRGRAVARAPWSSVSALGPTHVRLSAGPGADAARHDDELRLVRDVLDAQVVDVVGHRVLRVGDVELAGHDGRLRVVAVDASFAAVLRRLGLGWLAARNGTEAIDWSDVHLASGAGHAVQLDSPAAAVHRLGRRDLAALVAGLPPVRAQEVLARIGPERAAATRAATPPHRHRFPHRRRRRAAA